MKPEAAIRENHRLILDANRKIGSLRETLSAVGYIDDYIRIIHDLEHELDMMEKTPENILDPERAEDTMSLAASLRYNIVTDHEDYADPKINNWEADAIKTASLIEKDVLALNVMTPKGKIVSLEKYLWPDELKKRVMR